MHNMRCCRLCRNAEFLNPIFSLSKYNTKYTEIIFNVTGIKVEMNDMLPQEMCTTCIIFINEVIKFRRKCKETEIFLQGTLKEPYTFQIDSQLTKQSCVEIDISDMLPLDDDFKDFDDNVTLDTFRNGNTETEKYKYNAISDKCSSTNKIEFATSIDTTLNSPPNIAHKRKRGSMKRNKNDSISYQEEKIKRKTVNVKEDQKLKQGAMRDKIECEHCHKILTSKLSMRNHYKIHTGFDVVCEHCGKKFITRRLLLMHCRAKHGYEKTDKCSYCEYRGSNAEQVKIHERLHTGEKPYVCKECSTGFHRKSSYLQHIAIHLPEKTVQCDQCPARFKSVTLMRIHKNRHRAPQYSYKCRVCDNSFARRRNVVRHLQRIHGLPPEDEHIDRVKIS